MILKYIVIGLILIHSSLAFSQEKVEWSDEIEITLNSFKANLPDLAEDNLQEYSFAISYEFNFQMLSLQFVFTKNFNNYVSAYYVPDLSWIEEGELTDQLLLMANLDFDLVELYARKFRKRMFESKNATSNSDFYTKIHNEVNQEYMNQQSVIQSNLSSIDNVNEYLRKESIAVNNEIVELEEYCKSCKPKKKKNRARR